VPKSYGGNNVKPTGGGDGMKERSPAAGEDVRRMVMPGAAELQAIRNATLDRSYVSMGSRRTSSVHEFYRYPARFSPQFARAVIRAFSRPGQVVLDPFVGGGTSVVEARLSGRIAIGSDLNTLAAFVSRTKAAIQSEAGLRRLREWATDLPRAMNVHKPATVDPEWGNNGYLRHLGTRETWRLRKVIAQALGKLDELGPGDPHDLARLAVLRTAQWALDMRGALPGVGQFRSQLVDDTLAMADVAAEYSRTAKTAETVRPGSLSRTLVLHQSLPGLFGHPRLCGYPSPSLVLTSPPYPGVYVLYHRWKVRGRLETPAPFWIANCLDGKGLAHYTMASRSRTTLDSYFERLQSAYADIAALASPETWIVQVVGFNDVAAQLPRYLAVMDAVGLEEVRFTGLATASDSRLWRNVPSRRWWVASNALKAAAPQTAQEVVLFHRRRSE
jgi:hypothetical protein